MSSRIYGAPDMCYLDILFHMKTMNAGLVLFLFCFLFAFLLFTMPLPCQFSSTESHSWIGFTLPWASCNTVAGPLDRNKRMEFVVLARIQSKEPLKDAGRKLWVNKSMNWRPFHQGTKLQHRKLHSTRSTSFHLLPQPSRIQTERKKHELKLDSEERQEG